MPLLKNKIALAAASRSPSGRAPKETICVRLWHILTRVERYCATISNGLSPTDRDQIFTGDPGPDRYGEAWRRARGCAQQGSLVRSAPTAVFGQLSAGKSTIKGPGY